MCVSVISAVCSARWIKLDKVARSSRERPFHHRSTAAERCVKRAYATEGTREKYRMVARHADAVGG